MCPLPVLPANVMVSLSYLLFKCYLEIFSVRNKNCLIFPFLKMNFDASIPFSLIFRPSPLPTPPSSPDYEVERELTLFGSNEYVSPPNSPDYASLYESYIGNITPILLYFSIAVSFLLFFSLKHLRKLYGYSNPTNTTTECAFELRGRCASRPVLFFFRVFSPHYLQTWSMLYQRFELHCCGFPHIDLSTYARTPMQQINVPGVSDNPLQEMSRNRRYRRACRVAYPLKM